MATQQLTDSQRLDRLEHAQERQEAKLDKLIEGNAEIMIALARADERQTSLESHLLAGWIDWKPSLTG